MKLPHPIKRARMLLTPPCSACEKSADTFYGRLPKCRSEKYLVPREKTACIRYRFADVDLVRGTRFCEFEPKTGGE